MADSAADAIRRAAQLLRERAMAAPAGAWKHIPHPPTAGRGPTYHAVDCPPQPPYTVSENVCDTGPYERGAAIAEHIAGMRPAVALRLADWLEFEALRLDETAGDPGADESRGMFALDLAHAYLGEVTE